MSWRVQPADSNTIELVWDELERKVKTRQPTSAAQLLQLLHESWAELSSVKLQSLVERTTRICEAVIAAKGGHFNKSKVKEFLKICISNVAQEDLYLV